MGIVPDGTQNVEEMSDPDAISAQLEIDFKLTLTMISTCAYRSCLRN